MATKILYKGSVLFLYGQGVRAFQRPTAASVFSGCGRGGRKYSSSMNEEEEALGNEETVPATISTPQTTTLRLSSATVVEERSKDTHPSRKPDDDPASPWLDIMTGICSPEGSLPGMVSIPADQVLANVVSDREAMGMQNLTQAAIAVTPFKGPDMMMLYDKQQSFGRELVHENNGDRYNRIVDDFVRTSQANEIDPMILFFSNFLEVRVQPCPKLLIKDVQRMLPGWARIDSNITAITISQGSDSDMGAWSEEMEDEREVLMGAFVNKAKRICAGLTERGQLADFVDPGSGKPHYGENVQGTLFDNDERYIHLGFTIEDLGCCKVMNHNEYGTHVFIGVIFTTARPNSAALQLVLENVFEDPHKTKITSSTPPLL